MIIYLNQSGRFGHQLSMFIVLLIYAIQHNKKIYYPLFNKKYLSLLEIDYKFIKYIKYDINIFYKIKLYFKLTLIKYILPKKNKLLNAYPYLDNYYKDCLVDKSTIQSMFQEKGNTITNYLLSDIDSCIKRRDFLIKTIQFDRKLDNVIKNDFFKLRENGYKIIGLHIRLTDFKNFANGQYYFEIDEYFNILKRCISKIKNKCIVYICSDENLDINKYKNQIEDIRYSNREFIEDFLILKNADYIISTRSVFAIMANYFGNNKIFQFLDSNLDNQQIDFLDSTTLLNKYYQINSENNRI